MQNPDHSESIAPRMDIQAHVCPRGHVYLYVGHTCLFLRREEFLDVAQTVHATEHHLLGRQGADSSERRH
jgi:hypothetical protein